jgi:hypothetical protein
MDNLPQGFTAAQRRVAMQAQVAAMHPRDLAEAIAVIWPAKLGKGQAFAHARALVDMIEASK